MPTRIPAAFRMMRDTANAVLNAENVTAADRTINQHRGMNNAGVYRRADKRVVREPNQGGGVFTSAMGFEMRRSQNSASPGANASPEDSVSHNALDASSRCSVIVATEISWALMRRVARCPTRARLTS